VGEEAFLTQTVSEHTLQRTQPNVAIEVIRQESQHDEGTSLLSLRQTVAQLKEYLDEQASKSCSCTQIVPVHPVWAIN
jgi:hypothetical protein